MKRAPGFITIALAIFLSIFFNSCSKHNYQFDPNSAKYYPSPPDTARIQFLTSISSSSSIEKQRGGFTRFLLGDSPVKSIVKPYGIASQPGKLYICDPQLGGIEIINFEERKFEYFIPTGKGKLSKPINCDIDEEGKLFVADWKRKQVIVFDEDGKFFQEIGGNADFKPTDVAVYKSILFVNDLNNHKVVAFDKKTYSKLYSFPHSEVGDEDYIYSATNICIDDSVIYVSDLGDSKIKKYKHDGTFIGSFGSIGRNPGQFARIKGIDIDQNSNIYAVDAAFENIQIFNAENHLLMYIGGSSKEPGGMWLPANVSIDYINLEYFEQFVDPQFNLEYLIYVTNQYGPNKVNVYGFIKPKEKEDE